MTGTPEPGGQPQNVTRLLNLITSRERDPAVRTGLTDAVYAELRSIASRLMAGERRGHTLQATALVSEAYLRLVGDLGLAWESRRHFYAAAAEAMRRVLIEHARKRGRVKRGGDWRRLTLDRLDLAGDQDLGGILALDDALGRLAEVDARAAEVVRLRFYAGIDVDETARTLDCSRRTVLRDWAYAKAWLARALDEPEPPPSQP